MDCHFLLQGTFLIEGSNLILFHLLHSQMGVCQCATWEAQSRGKVVVKSVFIVVVTQRHMQDEATSKYILYIYTHTHTHTHTHRVTYIHTLYIYKYIHTQSYIHTHAIYVYIHTHTELHIYTRYIHIHTHTVTYIHTHTVALTCA